MKRYLVERIKTGGKWPMTDNPYRMFKAGMFGTRKEAVEWMKLDIEKSREKWPDLGSNVLFVSGEDYCSIGKHDKGIDYLIVKVGWYEMFLNVLRKRGLAAGNFPVDLPPGM